MVIYDYIMTEVKPFILNFEKNGYIIQNALTKHLAQRIESCLYIYNGKTAKFGITALS